MARSSHCLLREENRRCSPVCPIMRSYLRSQSTLHQTLAPTSMPLGSGTLWTISSPL